MNNDAIKEATKAVWGTNPAGWTFADGYKKGSKEFFESVLQKRFTQECEWMDEIVHFERFRNKKVLEIGCGAGYDAYQFCKHGAVYTGIDITPDNPIIAQKHLAYFGYQAKFLEMDAEKLSVPEKFDFVFSFGVLHHTPDITKAMENIYAILKPGGEAQIIVYYKYSIFYLLHLALFDWILTFKFLKMSLEDRLSQIEYTESGSKPLVKVYSARQFKRICRNAGFIPVQTDIRKLTRDDLPHIPGVGKLYRLIPNSWLYFLSKRFGWYLSVRMIKK